MQGPGQWRWPAQHGLVPRHRVHVEDPEVAQSATAHAPEDNELGVGAIPVHPGHGRVRLALWRRRAVARGHVPLHLARVGAQLQRVQVV